MLRTVFIPESNSPVFSLPDEYVGKRLEVMIKQADGKTSDCGRHEKKKIKFNAVSLDTRNFKFNRDEANERR